MRGLGFSKRLIGAHRLALSGLFALFAAMTLSNPAAAQFSDSYKFLKAVRDKDGTVATEMLRNPSTNIINTRDFSSGETALHIVVKRRDTQWLSFLLGNGADPNARDSEGNTPMMTAAQLRFADGIQELVNGKANVNATNSRGETPLIVAVQNRDIASVRSLLAAGADPKLADRIAGMSARDYAVRDNRSDAILKMIDDNKAVAPKGPIAGPKF